MLLEQKIDEVSNRYSSIDEAIAMVQKILIPSSFNIDNFDKNTRNNPEETASENNDDVSTLLKIEAVEYSFADENFAGEFYNTPSLDYEKLFADEKIRIKKESEDYKTSSDTTAEMMSAEEAEEMTERYQFAVVLGGIGDISYAERRRFSAWADFNPVERELFHRQYAMTDNVNYSKVF